MLASWRSKAIVITVVIAIWLSAGHATAADELAGPWGPLRKDDCQAEGFRQVSAEFLPHGDDWRQACRATARNIMGVPDRLPRQCVVEGSFLKIFGWEHRGQWDVADASCASKPPEQPTRGGLGTLASTAPLEGYADLHVHQMADLGFAGTIIWGGAFGDPASVLGPIPSAYKHGHDATEVASHGHSEAGAAFQALINKWFDWFRHDERGSPAFTGWPAHNIWMHQQVYEDWLFRAYQGGLRLMVLLAVNSEDPFGRAENQIPFGLGHVTFQSARKIGRTGNDMEALEWQVRAAYEMQHEIDLKNGGTGKGWYRIVRDPQEASDAIAGGRLAVILGTELQHLFNCDLDRPLCTHDTIIEGLNRLEAMGVNYVFPVHHKLNQFGGPATFQPLNSGPTINCPDLSHDCSPFGLSPIGRFLVSELTTRGMLIDTEHLSRIAFVDAMSIVEPLNYPVLAGHVVPRDLQMRDDQQSERTRTSEEIRRILGVGGLAAPMLDTASEEYVRSATAASVVLPVRCTDSAREKDGGADQWANAYLLIRDLATNGATTRPIPFGSDWNGLAGWPEPRHDPKQSCAPRHTRTRLPFPIEQPVVYPIDLPSELVPAKFRPPDDKLHLFVWPDQTTNVRPWDFNTVGAAHIGMIPDFVENLRQLGLTLADLEPFYRSARGVVDLWTAARDRDVPNDRHHLRWAPQSPFDVLNFEYADPSRDVEAQPGYPICRTREGHTLGFIQDGACRTIAAADRPEREMLPIAISVYFDGRCLDVHNGSLDEGARIEQMPCSTATRQQWRLRAAFSATYEIVNQKSGKCLAIPSGRVSVGVRAVQQTCTGASEQQWRAERVGNTFSLKGSHSGLCLEVREQSRDAGAAVQQSACTGASNQLWTIDSLRVNDFERLYQADKNRSAWLETPTAEFLFPVTDDDDRRQTICRSETPEPWLGVVAGGACVRTIAGGGQESSPQFQALYQAR